jgi:plasmid stabilization system protein ParE
MAYKVVITKDAELDLQGFIEYLLYEKQSEQAARNVLDDFELTKASLATVAGSIKLCENPRLRELGYRKIHFISHRYFMMYRVEGKLAIVDSIFHDLQDYESKMQ